MKSESRVFAKNETAGAPKTAEDHIYKASPLKTKMVQWQIIKNDQAASWHTPDNDLLQAKAMINNNNIE